MCNFVKIFVIGWIRCCWHQFNFNGMSNTLFDIQRAFISSRNQSMFNRFRKKTLCKSIFKPNAIHLARRLFLCLGTTLPLSETHTLRASNDETTFSVSSFLSQLIAYCALAYHSCTQIECFEIKNFVRAFTKTAAMQALFLFSSLYR